MALKLEMSKKKDIRMTKDLGEKSLSENLKETDLFHLWEGRWRCEFITAIQYQQGGGQGGK